MGKGELMREALRRQGTSISLKGRTLKIPGGPTAAEFQTGREGLVQLAVDVANGEKYRIKCFWNPDERRRRRSDHLVGQRLANPQKYKADALGGAPIEMLTELGPCTPFALVMRNVRGESWEKLKSRAHDDQDYPPRWWPSVSVRATWAYGLATAVKQMEQREFIHSDLSLGNVVVSDGIHGVADGNGQPPTNDEFAGDMALVDFDRYVHQNVEPPEDGKGSKGYAAREVWEGKTPVLGSDRTSMAILIQEFLVTGDSDIPREQAFEWFYDQERRAFGYSSGDVGSDSQPLFGVHPLVARKYPSVAGLIEDTVRAAEPLGRPEPEKWRDAVRPIAELSPSPAEPAADPAPVPPPVKPQSLPFSPRIVQLTVEEITSDRNPYRLSLGSAMKMLNLAETAFGIRATLKRDPDRSIFLSIHDSASIQVKYPGASDWVDCPASARVEVRHGTEVRDSSGGTPVRLLGPR